LQSGCNTQLKTCTIPGLMLEGDSGEEIVDWQQYEVIFVK
jgi:hypothetical protein